MVGISDCRVLALEVVPHATLTISSSSSSSCSISSNSNSASSSSSSSSSGSNGASSGNGSGNNGASGKPYSLEASALPKSLLSLERRKYARKLSMRETFGCLAEKEP